MDDLLLNNFKLKFYFVLVLQTKRQCIMWDFKNALYTWTLITEATCDSVVTTHTIEENVMEMSFKFASEFNIEEKWTPSILWCLLGTSAFRSMRGQNEHRAELVCVFVCARKQPRQWQTLSAVEKRVYWSRVNAPARKASCRIARRPRKRHPTLPFYPEGPAWFQNDGGRRRLLERRRSCPSPPKGGGMQERRRARLEVRTKERSRSRLGPCGKTRDNGLRRWAERPRLDCEDVFFCTASLENVNKFCFDLQLMLSGLIGAMKKRRNIVVMFNYDWYYMLSDLQI